MANDPYTHLRNRMVDRHLGPSDIEDDLILDAMRVVPRHLFVPEDKRAHAYADHPVEVGWGQTISQPYLVAYMIQLAQVDPGDKVLDVGTGSGYQAAVLDAMGAEVFTIEVLPALAAQAERSFTEAGTKVTATVGDGYQGWAEHAPFNAILVACSPDHVPQPLLDQLEIGGRLVIPVGDPWEQRLVCVERRGPDEWERSSHLAVLFVPLTGPSVKPPNDPADG